MPGSPGRCSSPPADRYRKFAITCPFQTSRSGRAGWVARWAAHPASAASALRLEYTALAFNPRTRLFDARTGWDLAVEHGLTATVDATRRGLSTARWAVYEVRRTYTGPSAAMRSVQVLASGTRTGMHSALAGMTPGGVEVDAYGIHRGVAAPTGARVPACRASAGRGTRRGGGQAAAGFRARLEPTVRHGQCARWRGRRG